MAQNLQIRRAPSGVVIAEKAVDFYEGPDITLLVDDVEPPNPANVKDIATLTIGLVSDVQSDQLSLVAFTANLFGDDFAVITPAPANGDNGWRARMKFESTIPGGPITFRPALVFVFPESFVAAPNQAFVAFNGAGTFGVNDGQVKMTLQMWVKTGAGGKIQSTAQSPPGTTVNTVVAAIVQ